MSQHNRPARAGSRFRVGSAATALLSILIFFTPAMLVHAADAPTSGTTAEPKPATSPATAAAQRTSKDGSAKPFLGGTSDGTGIRKAAPTDPKKPGDGRAKPFLGGGIEGTGIRRAAPVDPKAAASANERKPGDGSVKPFLGGSQEGTGIRKAAPTNPKKPGDGSAKPFLGGTTEGTGIRKSAPIDPKAAASVAAAKADASKQKKPATQVWGDPHVNERKAAEPAVTKP